MQIDACLEDVGVAGQRQRREISAVRAAPDTYALAIDARQRLQEAGSRHDILIFGGARETGVLGMMKRQAIADAETIVDRQHDETMRRQLLIHGVAVAVVIHVTPTEQHLPRRPPGQKYHSTLS